MGATTSGSGTVVVVLGGSDDVDCWVAFTVVTGGSAAACSAAWSAAVSAVSLPDEEGLGGSAVGVGGAATSVVGAGSLVGGVLGGAGSPLGVLDSGLGAASPGEAESAWGAASLAVAASVRRWAIVPVWLPSPESVVAAAVGDRCCWVVPVVPEMRVLPVVPVVPVVTDASVDPTCFEARAAPASPVFGETPAPDVAGLLVAEEPSAFLVDSDPGAANAAALLFTIRRPAASTREPSAMRQCEGVTFPLRPSGRPPAAHRQV
jgi:hypothetical protein